MLTAMLRDVPGGTDVLWPKMPTQALRIQLFAALALKGPNVLVHRWNAYQSDVPSLHPEDIEKIDAAAGMVISTLGSSSPVRAILIQGHADYDLRRSGQDREDFEMKISKARAAHVLERLQASLALRRPLLPPEQKNLLDVVFWRVEGLGSHRRINTHPKNEYEMSLNRRAEIFFGLSEGPLIPAAVIICPHGGAVTRGQYAQGLPSAEDSWVVIGCADMSGQQPIPCVRVQWVQTNGGIIDATSVGVCITADGVAMGPATIVA